MIVQCKTCIVRFNDETVQRCPECFPKKVKKVSPSRKRKNALHWEKVKFKAHVGEIMTEMNKQLPPKENDYFAKGKRKNWPEV